MCGVLIRIIYDTNYYKFNLFNWNIGLTEDALSLIEEMRLRHEVEINCLAEQLNFNPEFIKVSKILF